MIVHWQLSQILSSLDEEGGGGGCFGSFDSPAVQKVSCSQQARLHCLNALGPAGTAPRSAA